MVPIWLDNFIISYSTIYCKVLITYMYAMLYINIVIIPPWGRNTFITLKKPQSMCFVADSATSGQGQSTVWCKVIQGSIPRVYRACSDMWCSLWDPHSDQSSESIQTPPQRTEARALRVVLGNPHSFKWVALDCS